MLAAGAVSLAQLAQPAQSARLWQAIQLAPPQRGPGVEPVLPAELDPAAATRPTKSSSSAIHSGTLMPTQPVVRYLMATGRVPVTMPATISGPPVALFVRTAQAGSRLHVARFPRPTGKPSGSRTGRAHSVREALARRDDSVVPYRAEDRSVTGRIRPRRTISPPSYAPRSRPGDSAPVLRSSRSVRRETSSIRTRAPESARD
jgi:hypothetical protein